jgi:hypothetical protein
MPTIRSKVLRILDPLELLEGSLPVRQKRLVEGWAELHLEKLLEELEAIEVWKECKKD